MMKWLRFWRNLKALVYALATENSICITQPKQNRPLSKKEIRTLVISATKPTRTSRKPISEKAEIKWPEGAVSFEELCRINVNFSKAEIVKALGQKMEQSRKVLLT